MTDLFDGLPRQLRIGPFDVRVEVLELMDHAGTYDFSDLTIQLRHKQADGAFAVDTVLHEINHAIYRNAALSKRDKEERVVSAMATGWTQVYRDNPGLLAWVSAAFKQQAKS